MPAQQIADMPCSTTRGSEGPATRSARFLEPAHAEGVKPWWRVVDTTAAEPEPDTTAAITLPKAMPWPID
jgi:hypothetical protein